jgi:hypothetical protein
MIAVYKASLEGYALEHNSREHVGLTTRRALWSAWALFPKHGSESQTRRSHREIFARTNPICLAQLGDG